jgi:hypothetical protein
MVDKVVDMAVIHKITQLTDAVRTLGENEKEAVYCIKELTKMVMDLDKRVNNATQSRKELLLFIDVLTNRIKYLEICNEEHTDKLARLETMIMSQGIMPLE